MNAVAVATLIATLGAGMSANAEQIRYLTLSTPVSYSGHSRAPLQVIDSERRTIGSEDFRLEYTDCDTDKIWCIRIQDKVLVAPKIDLPADAVVSQSDFTMRVVRKGLRFELLGREMIVTVVAIHSGDLTTEVYVHEMFGIVAFSVFSGKRLVDNHVLMSRCGLFASDACELR